jgi:hypothetical protein
MLGVIFGISASLCVALNSIFVKRVLPLVEGNEWKLTLYNNFNATILFLPLMIVLGEVSELSTFPKLLVEYVVFFTYVLAISILVCDDNGWIFWCGYFYCYHFTNQIYQPSHSQCLGNR